MYFTLASKNNRMEAYNEHFSAYKELRSTIDTVADTLSAIHKHHMKCKKGCDLCCMDYAILPIEFHFIQNEINAEMNMGKTIKTSGKSDGCIFLKNNSCTIYKHRPVICRTHGLPLLYTNDDYEWELSTCELNFRKYDYGRFTPDNTFPQDKINSRLFMLNKKFITEFREKKYDEPERIPLKKLAEQML